MKAYNGAVDQQLSEDVGISTDVVSVQLGVVLIVVCTGRDLDPVAKAPRGWIAKAWRRMFRTDSLKNDARLVVLMMMVLPLTLDTNDIVSGMRRMP